MYWLKISVQSPPQLSEAVANIFYEIGSGGVVIEDPALIADYIAAGQWDTYEFAEEVLTRTYNSIIGYLPLPEHEAEYPLAYHELAARLNTLEKETCQSFDVFAEEVSDADWANNWRHYFKPYKPGEKIVIQPLWREYEPQTGELVVKLDPGLAFGTGTHATTSMCIKALEKLLQGGEFVYDVGTGSGVLALVAARLGAAQVQAFDIDSVAVKAARENVAVNELEKQISVAKANLLDQAGQRQADVIIANIVADVIIELMPVIPELLKDDGVFLASGIIESRWPEVRESLMDCGMAIEDLYHDNQWLAVTAVKIREFEPEEIIG